MAPSVFLAYIQYILINSLTLRELYIFFLPSLVPLPPFKFVSNNKCALDSLFQFIYDIQPSSLHIFSAYTGNAFNYCSFSCFFWKVKPIKSISLPDHRLHGFESKLHRSHFRRVRWEINCIYIQVSYCSFSELRVVNGCIINKNF